MWKQLNQVWEKVCILNFIHYKKWDPSSGKLSRKGAVASAVSATQEWSHSALLCHTGVGSLSCPCHTGVGSLGSPVPTCHTCQGWPGLHQPLAQPHLTFPHSNSFFPLHRLFMNNALQKLDFFQECEAPVIITRVTICAGRARAPCSPHLQGWSKQFEEEERALRIESCKH